MKPSSYGPFKYVPLPERPRLVWPQDARIALWIAPNIEFFGLDSVLPGKNNERIPRDRAWFPAVRTWAIRDYGNRIGIWRIMEVMTKHKLRGTAPLNSRICDEHPQIIDAVLKLGWEFMGHNQTNSIRLADLKPEEEENEIRQSLDRIERATGRRPVGWLGAGTTETWNTLDYLVAEKCKYVGDWTNDEQPYLMSVGGKQLVSLPYSSDINDVTLFFDHRFSPSQYEDALRRQFDVLYRDGSKTGRVIGIPVHPFITGTPQRIDAFDSALSYMLSHAGVWPATGTEIVEWYLQSGATF